MKEFRKSVAVVVGINDYENGISCLKNAVPDARKIGELLEQEHHYEQLQVINQDATLAGLRNLLRHELPAMIGPDDRVLFYFAGHGVATDNDDGPAGYLVPQDARPEDGSTFLPMVELHDALSALTCRHMLIILDCCFGGAFRWSSTRFLKAEPSVVYHERLTRYLTDAAWQVITSAAHDQKAQDKRGDGQHSPFALALLEALKGAGDIFPPGVNGQLPGDGVITATELYLYLRDRLEPSFSAAGRQTPGFWPLRKHDKGEYVFLNPVRRLSLPRAETLTAATNPYRGLKPFEEQHANLFFGRESVEKDLAETVTANSLTVVIGPSGSGKSSAVQAGLIPRLRKLGSTKWHIPSVQVEESRPIDPRAHSIRPGIAPLQSLNDFIRNDPELLAASDAVKPDFYTDPQALAKVIKHWSADFEDRKLLLFVDQLEELVTMCRHDDERLGFLQQLSAALTENPGCLQMVVTVRSDFEPQFLRSALSNRWRTARFIVPPMTQNELRQAIEGPASARVIYFESSALVDEIINEVIQMPGALPLLSFTLSEMYIKYLQSGMNDRALTKEHYDSLGGVVGSLRRRANEEFDQLRSETLQQKTMRRVMLRMVALEGNEVARRRVPASELIFADPAENKRVDDIIKQLTEARLLVKGIDAQDESYVEPAHDALVRGWDLLWTWLRREQEQQDTLLLLRRLTQAAKDWEAGGRKPGNLWDDDPRSPLVEAEQSRRDFWLNRLESEFVSSSSKLRKSKRRKRNSWVTTAVVVLTTVAVFAGYQAIRATAAQKNAEAQQAEAIKQRNEADKQRTDANTQRDVANSETIRAQTAEGQAKGDRDRAQTAEGQAREDRDRAQAAERQANEDRDRAQTQLAESRFLSAQAEVDLHNDVGKALLMVSNALDAAPANDPRREIFERKSLYLSTRLPRLVTQLPRRIAYAAFSPDREKVLTHAHDNKLRLWNARTGREFPTVQFPFAKFFLDQTVFDLSGQRIAVVINERTTYEKVLCTWQVETAASLLDRPCVPLTRDDKDVAFSPDGKFLLMSRDEPRAARSITIWKLGAPASVPIRLPITGYFSLADWTYNSPFDHFINQPKYSLFLSPNPVRNWMIAVTTQANIISAQIIDIDTQAPLAGSLPIKPAGMIQSIQFTPDAARVITISATASPRTYEIALWDSASGKLMPTPQRMTDDYEFKVLDVSRSGRKILTTARRDKQLQCLSGERVRVWDAASGSSRYLSIEESEQTYGIVFSQDEKSVVAISKDQILRVIDLESGDLSAEPFRFPVPVNGIFSVQTDFLLSPGTSSIVSLTSDGSLSFWDPSIAANRARVLALPHPPTQRDEYAFTEAVFTPDRKAVLTKSAVNNVPQLQLWSVETGKPLWDQPIALDVSTRWSAISLDGRRLAVAQFADTQGKAFIRVYDMADGSSHHWDPIVVDDVFSFDDIALNPTGDRVTVALSSNAKQDHPVYVQQFDVTYQSELGAPAEYENGLVSFLPDGLHYLVGTQRDFAIHQIEKPSETSPDLHFENNSGLEARLARELILQAVDLRISDDGIRLIYPFGSLLIKTSPTGATITNLATNSLVTAPNVPRSKDDSFTDVFSPDGRWIVTLSPYPERPRENFNRNLSLSLSETQTGQPVWDNLWHERSPLAATFDLLQDRLITISVDGNLRIWRLGSRPQDRASWVAQAGSALTGTRLDGEKTVQRIPQPTYSALRDRFFERLRREPKSSLSACQLLQEFGGHQCTQP